MLIRPTEETLSRSDILRRPLASDWTEIEALCSLCEDGRLYEAEKWIAEGKPIQCERPSEKSWHKRHSPLQTAVSKGFHSLAALLLVNGYDPNNDYYENLSPAVTAKNLPMVELLLRMGADPFAVDFETVLETYDRKLMDCFIAAGVNPCAKNATARALRHKGRPLLGFVKSYLEQFPELHRQVTIALRSFADEEDEKGVSLMLWLKADPYLEVPKSAWDDESDDSWNEAPLVTALRTDNTAIIAAMLKVSIPQERVPFLLSEIAYHPNSELVRRLLKMGADPNAEHEGQHILRQYVFSACWQIYRNLHPTHAQQAVQAIAALSEAGAKWSLDKKALADLRRTLLDGQSDVVRAIFELFKKHDVMPPEQIHELTRTPAMKRVMAGYTKPYRDPFASLAKPVYDYAVAPAPAPRRGGYWKRHWSQRG